MIPNADQMAPAQFMREMTFGDVPLAYWRPHEDDAMKLEPWASFERARQCVSRRDTRGAIEALMTVIYQRNLESRQYLEAWQGLKELGVNPPPEMAMQLYGVVVEVDQPEGLDVLAAYTDYSVYYINYTGKMTIWNTRTPAMDSHVDELLAAARNILPFIGPWEGKRPGPPPKGQVRINLLTSNGLCFGQGSWEALNRDGRGGHILGAAAQLLKTLVDLQVSQQKK